MNADEEENENSHFDTTLYKSQADINYAERLPTQVAVITMLRDPAHLVQSTYLHQWDTAVLGKPLPFPKWVCNGSC